MKINTNKIRVLLCTKKEQTRHGCIKINQENLEGVKEFLYLGSKITWNGRGENEIKSNIAQAKMGFNSKQQLLCSFSISLKKQEDSIEDICMDVKPGQSDKQREKDWKLSKYGATKE